MSKTINLNKAYAVISAILNRIALFFSTGAFMQTFLSVLGFSSEDVYLHSTVVQLVNVLTIVLGSGLGDRGNILRRMAITHIPIGLMFLGYLPLCITRSSDFSAFLLLIGVSVVQSAFTGARTVFDYKIPYYIYTPADYADINAVSGALSSVISFAVGALLSYLSSIVDYVSLMLAGFTVSAAFVLVAGALHLLMRSVIVPEGKEETETRVSLISIFKQPIFSHLLLPNFLRGVAMGATTVIAVAALELGYGESVAVALVSIESVAIFLASFAFGFLSRRRVAPRASILIGTAAFLAFPLLLVRDNPVLFLSAYAVLMLGRNVVDVAVPSALIYTVPREIAGQYNAWRMILHNGGALLATGVAALIPPEALFIIAMLAQLVSGVSFFLLRVMRENLKTSRL